MSWTAAGNTLPHELTAVADLNGSKRQLITHYFNIASISLVFIQTNMY